MQQRREEEKQQEFQEKKTSEQFHKETRQRTDTLQALTRDIGVLQAHIQRLEEEAAQSDKRVRYNRYQSVTAARREKEERASLGGSGSQTQGSSFGARTRGTVGSDSSGGQDTAPLNSREQAMMRPAEERKQQREREERKERERLEKEQMKESARQRRIAVLEQFADDEEEQRRRVAELEQYEMDLIEKIRQRYDEEDEALNASQIPDDPDDGELYGGMGSGKDTAGGRRSETGAGGAISQLSPKSEQQEPPSVLPAVPPPPSPLQIPPLPPSPLPCSSPSLFFLLVTPSFS
jgi:hypothetical protein